MHHLAIETCLFQRKMGVRELPKEDPRTYVVYVEIVAYMKVRKKSVGTNSG